MDIKRVAIDAVHSTIVISIAEADYKEQVEKRINKQIPLANIKGFRKGQAPKSLIEKMYAQPFKQEEVSRAMDMALQKYIGEEKLNLLGSPLPKVAEDFSWEAADFTFEFEIGLVPEFEINLEAANGVVKYAITADDKLIDGQVTRIQKQFGKAISQDTVTADSDITGTFTNEAEGIKNTTTINFEIFADKAIADKFIGKKVGDVVTVNTKGLFADDHQLMNVMAVSHDVVHTLAVDVDFTIEGVTTSELAELNQELFDKLFGEGKVASLDELKAKIKEDAEAHFAQQADQKYMGDVTDFLIENTKFDLPATFLKKWLQTAGEKVLTAEEAEMEYVRSEKGLRFQLIEGKALSQNNVQVTFDDLKAYAGNIIRQQMAQFGQLNPTEEDVNDIVGRVLTNQEEVKRLSEQVVAEKLIELIKEKANPTVKEVTYEQFIAASYGE